MGAVGWGVFQFVFCDPGEIVADGHGHLLDAGAALAHLARESLVDEALGLQGDLGLVGFEEAERFLIVLLCDLDDDAGQVPRDVEPGAVLGGNDSSFFPRHKFQRGRRGAAARAGTYCPRGAGAWGNNAPQALAIKNRPTSTGNPVNTAGS